MRSLADEVPFDIPDSWEWVRLIDVCEYIQRGKSPKYSPIKKYPVVAQKCNQWSGFSIEKAQFIEPDSLSSYGPERLLQDNDLMWNSTGLGTLGRMAIYKTAANPYELAVADSHVTVIRPLKQFVLPEYLYYYFANPTVQSVIEDQADGTTKQKELATATIKAYLTPIPPLDEQRRILTKLSEVLPVVKSYGAVYGETVAMQDAFPERLKKSILQEAVQGKLVPQDPSDEPAEALLERIRAEKQRLIKEGKIKKDKHESVIFRRDNSHYEKLDGVERCIDDELPFEIPESWAWAYLGNISFVTKLAGFEYTKYIAPALTNRGIPLFKGKNIQNGKLIEHFEGFIPETVSDELWRSQLSKRCLLTPYVGSIGNVAVFPGTYKAHLGSNVGKIEPYSGNGVLIEYILFYLRSTAGYEQLTKHKKATAQESISIDAIRNVLIPIPPLNEQERIVSAIDAALSIVQKL